MKSPVIVMPTGVLRGSMVLPLVVLLWSQAALCLQQQQRSSNSLQASLQPRAVAAAAAAAAPALKQKPRQSQVKKKNLGLVRPEAGPRAQRRLKRVNQEDVTTQRVSVYCVGEEVLCEELVEGLKSGFVRRPEGDWSDKVFDASVHSQLNEKHVFTFAFGCVVLWGFDKRTEREVVSGLLAADLDFVQGTTSAAERVDAHDTFLFDVTGSYSCTNDKMSLAEADDAVEKFALSFAMAQSAKLFLFESRVADAIDDLQTLPELLAQTGKIGLTEKEISQKIGQVFLTRAQVNLRADILDSPDYFWEQDAKHEKTYGALYDYLDVPDRVDLLNRRLDVLKDLLEVLNTQLANRHSSNLEYIIIYLIVVETVVSIATFVVDHLWRW